MFVNGEKYSIFNTDNLAGKRAGNYRIYCYQTNSYSSQTAFSKTNSITVKYTAINSFSMMSVFLNAGTILFNK